jgi:hypothetical protein
MSGSPSFRPSSVTATDCPIRRLRASRSAVMARSDTWLRKTSSMRVRQRVYLRIASDALDPGQVSKMSGLDPDEARLRGSHSPGPPPKPRSHLWFRYSGLTEDLPLDDHLDVIFGIIRDHSDGLRRVASAPETAAWLQVVRYLEEGPEDFDEATHGLPADSPFERLSGQHPLLGWGLAAERVELLAKAGIGLDVDEYG